MKRIQLRTYRKPLLNFKAPKDFKMQHKVGIVTGVTSQGPLKQRLNASMPTTIIFNGLCIFLFCTINH